MFSNTLTCAGCRQPLMFATKPNGGREFPDRIVHVGAQGRCRRYGTNPEIIRAREAVRVAAEQEADRVRKRIELMERITTLSRDSFDLSEAIDAIEETFPSLDDPESENYIPDPAQRAEFETKLKNDLRKAEDERTGIDLRRFGLELEYNELHLASVRYAESLRAARAA